MINNHFNLEVMAEYKDQVRIVFKHLPLDFHPQALPAAKYFEAIARQGQNALEAKSRIENKNFIEGAPWKIDGII